MSPANGLTIAVPRGALFEGTVDLLAGIARPAYGELRVLGQDLTTSQGRAVVRREPRA